MPIGSPTTHAGACRLNSLPSEVLFTVGAIVFLVLLMAWDGYRRKAEGSVIDAHRKGREQGREEAHREQTDANLERYRRDVDFRRRLRDAAGVEPDDDAAFDRWKCRWIEHEHGVSRAIDEYLDIEDDGELPRS